MPIFVGFEKSDFDATRYIAACRGEAEVENSCCSGCKANKFYHFHHDENGFLVKCYHKTIYEIF